MTLRWTIEQATSWVDGRRLDAPLRVARRWRLRVLSDRRRSRGAGGAAPMDDFDAVVSDRLELWVRGFGARSPFSQEAQGAGASMQIVGNITGGVVHRVTVRAKPSDAALVRWSCSCSVTSRGALSPEAAREAADDHARSAVDGRPRPRDRVVDQVDGGSWAQREISVAGRFHLCVRSELSVATAHGRGRGEDFELVVDGRLGLWARRLGSDAALRKDEDARGVSLLTFEDSSW